MKSEPTHFIEVTRYHNGKEYTTGNGILIPIAGLDASLALTCLWRMKTVAIFKIYPKNNPA